MIAPSPRFEIRHGFTEATRLRLLENDVDELHQAIHDVLVEVQVDISGIRGDMKTDKAEVKKSTGTQIRLAVSVLLLFIATLLALIANLLMR